MAKNRLKIGRTNAAILAIIFGRFSAPFWSPFSAQNYKNAFLKYAFRMRHPSKIEPLAKNAFQKTIIKNRLKMTGFLSHFGPHFWVIFIACQKLFFIVIFRNIFILAETSLKNGRMGVTTSFYNFLYNFLKNELSPTREAQNAIFDFCKNHHFSSSGNAKSRCRLDESLIFAMLRLCKNMKKNGIFENCILRCKYAHIHGQRLPKWWKLATRGHPAELQSGSGSGWLQNGPKMDPKWIQKWYQNGPKIKPKIFACRNLGWTCCPRNGWADCLIFILAKSHTPHSRTDAQDTAKPCARRLCSSKHPQRTESIAQENYP